MRPSHDDDDDDTNRDCHTGSSLLARSSISQMAWERGVPDLSLRLYIASS